MTWTMCSLDVKYLFTQQTVSIPPILVLQNLGSAIELHSNSEPRFLIFKVREILSALSVELLR